MFWKKKPLVALDPHVYHNAVLEALTEGIISTERFALFAETTADSLRLINDLFSDNDPDDPEKLLYVDDFIYDLPISRAPESEMYVFLVFAFHVAAAYADANIHEPVTDWVANMQQQFYPTGRLHAPEISSDFVDAYYTYGDPGLNRYQRKHNLNRQELQFIGICMIYTMLSAVAQTTDTATTDIIDQLQADLAAPGPTFVNILKFPQKAPSDH